MMIVAGLETCRWDHLLMVMIVTTNLKSTPEATRTAEKSIGLPKQKPRLPRKHQS